MADETNDKNPGYSRIEVTGSISEPPRLLDMTDYWGKKVGLELMLNVSKVKFRDHPCEVPTKIPIAFRGILPIFKGGRVTAEGIITNGDYGGEESLKDYFADTSGHWFPNLIELLDEEGEVKAAYRQDTLDLFSPNNGYDQHRGPNLHNLFGIKCIGGVKGLATK